jgi:hypothetical protein
MSRASCKSKSRNVTNKAAVCPQAGDAANPITNLNAMKMYHGSMLIASACYYSVKEKTATSGHALKERWQKISRRGQKRQVVKDS